MSTEYHQLPSQQGLMPLELLADAVSLDPWLIAATSNLSLDAWTPTATTKANTKVLPRSLFESAGHNDSSVDVWNTPLSFSDNSLMRTKSPAISAIPNVPKEFYSTTSKIDAWTVQSSPLMDSKKKPAKLSQSQPVNPSQLNQSQQFCSLAQSQQFMTEDENGELKAIEDELAIQNRYKTELCKSFTETGICRYGTKCQFAHGKEEVRPILRHPKYKTETCKTFHSTGTCPYGIRCRFIHTRAKEEPVVFEEEKTTPQASPRWSKSWTPSNVAVGTPNLKKSGGSKKHGLGKITLVDAVPDY